MEEDASCSPRVGFQLVVYWAGVDSGFKAHLCSTLEKYSYVAFILAVFVYIVQKPMDTDKMEGDQLEIMRGSVASCLQCTEWPSDHLQVQNWLSFVSFFTL